MKLNLEEITTVGNFLIRSLIPTSETELIYNNVHSAAALWGDAVLNTLVFNQTYKDIQSRYRDVLPIYFDIYNKREQAKIVITHEVGVIRKIAGPSQEYGINKYAITTRHHVSSETMPFIPRILFSSTTSLGLTLDKDTMLKLYKNNPVAARQIEDHNTPLIKKVLEEQNIYYDTKVKPVLVQVNALMSLPVGKMIKVCPAITEAFPSALKERYKEYRSRMAKHQAVSAKVKPAEPVELTMIREKLTKDAILKLAKTTNEQDE